MIDKVEFKMEISTGNIAIVNDSRFETAHCLRIVADRIQQGHNYGNVKDYNGNTIGKFTYDETETEI